MGHRVSRDRPAQRARRLLRCYPRSWRTRYGEEFVELLVADLEERPGCWRRSADVVRAGITARFAAAGLAGSALEPEDQLRSSLGWLAGLLAVFLAFGLAMWSQLTIGWQWAAPATAGTTVATVVMSVAVMLLAVLALAALVPLLAAVCKGIFHDRRRGLALPAGVLAGASAFLVAGARHFGNGWPGTGGHPWAHQGLVPGGIAAFSWASTLSVTAYWGHPAALGRFPASELAWMVASPPALAAAVAATVKLVRRVELPPVVQRLEALLGALTCVVMAAFLAGAGCWELEGGPGPRELFHAGAIDVAGIAVISAVLALATRVVRLALQAVPAA
jgi:hypothetical protein